MTRSVPSVPPSNPREPRSDEPRPVPREQVHWMTEPYYRDPYWPDPYAG